MFFFFFFNDTATTEIYTLSLHDALPICDHDGQHEQAGRVRPPHGPDAGGRGGERSEEHTSELQSRSDLVCRLLLEKKKKNQSATKLIRTDLATYTRQACHHAHLHADAHV